MLSAYHWLYAQGSFVARLVERKNAVPDIKLESATRKAKCLT